MQTQIDKKTLRRVSLDFRTFASRLLTSRYQEGMDNLKRFIDFMESQPVILGYLKRCVNRNYDFEQEFGNSPYNIPHDTEAEVSFSYQLLKYALESVPAGHWDSGYMRLAGHGYSTGRRIQDYTDGFNQSVVQPFVDHVRRHLEYMAIEMGDDEASTFKFDFSGTGHQITIAQGSSSVSATNTTNVSAEPLDIQLVLSLIHELKSALPQLNLRPEDKEEFEAEVKVAEAQLISPRPKIKMIQESLKTLRSLLEGVAGNVLAAGLLQQFPQIMVMFS